MTNKNSLSRLTQHGVKNIPDNWQISKVKYLGTYINGYPFKPSDWGSSGRPILRIQNLSSPDAAVNMYDGEVPDRYLVRNGEILISWSASLGIYVWEGEESWLNQHIFKVLVDEKKIDRQYFIWLAKWFMEELARDAHGSTMQHLTNDAFGGFPILLPPFIEQKAISGFLRFEAGRIDSLIKSKETLIALLTEKRQTLMTQTIRQGLDPGVRMKDSGIEWLGQIPAHWKTERSRWLFTEKNERSETGEEDLLTVSHLTGVTLRSEKEVNMFEAESNEGYKKCSPGDLVINTLWAWMGAMGTAKIPGIVSPAYHVYTPGKHILPEYIDQMVRLPVFAKEVTRYSKGVWSSRLRLYPDGFYEVYFPVPPLEEQGKIIIFLKKEIAAIEDLKKATEETVGMLNERKAALISAAVTGQIEISVP